MHAPGGYYAGFKLIPQDVFVRPFQESQEGSSLPPGLELASFLPDQAFPTQFPQASLTKAQEGLDELSSPEVLVGGHAVALDSSGREGERRILHHP
jgi:hypothetical protein